MGCVHVQGKRLGANTVEAEIRIPVIKLIDSISISVLKIIKEIKLKLL
jgi:hypothetical protein